MIEGLERALLSLYGIHMEAKPAADCVSIYLRSAVAGGPSPALKLERCQDYCRCNWGGHGVVFDDAGTTGGLSGRPALRSLMAEADAGSTKIVVLYDLHSLSRDVFDLVTAMQFWVGRGIETHVVTSGGPNISVADFVQTYLLVEQSKAQRIARTKAGRELARLASERHKRQSRAATL
jgi:DNA invertase Pin-like site-specific DNA recombinase